MAVALILEGIIAEVFASRDALTGRYHPDFVAALVDVPDHVHPGWVDVDGVWMATKPLSPPSIDDIKAEAASRIVARYPIWRQINIIRVGGADLVAMTAYIDGVRDAADALEATMPVNFRDASHWPT